MASKFSHELSYILDRVLASQNIHMINPLKSLVVNFLFLLPLPYKTCFQTAAVDGSVSIPWDESRVTRRELFGFVEKTFSCVYADAV